MEVPYEDYELPIGHYVAEYLGAEEFTECKQDYGPTVKLNFVIVEGELEGSSADVLCSKRLAPRTKLYKLVRGISGGREFKRGDVVELDAWKGVRCRITVGPKQQGDGTAIVDATRIKEGEEDVPF